MVLHQLSGDMEITFQIRFCAYRIIISVETLVKTATHRRCGKVLTNIQTEMDKSSSTKQAISEYRNSDFQISGSVISSHKNIHLKTLIRFHIKICKLVSLQMGFFERVTHETLNIFTLKMNKTCQPLHNRQHL